MQTERSDDNARVRDAEDAKRSRERSGRDRAEAESGASPGPKGDAPILFLEATRPVQALRQPLPRDFFRGMDPAVAAWDGEDE